MGKHLHHSTCLTTGKRSYNTKATAKRAMRDSHFDDVSVYRCEECNNFHVGGWHGTKDRSAHRGTIAKPTMTATEASRYLHVSAEFIDRLIDSGKIRHEEGEPYRADIERIATH